MVLVNNENNNQPGHAATVVLYKACGIVAGAIGICMMLFAMMFFDEFIPFLFLLGLGFAIAGVLYYAYGVSYANKHEVKKEDMVEGKKSALKWLKSFLKIFLPIFAVIMIFFACNMTSDVSFSDSRSCGSCHREWTSGDDYRNIARTGLCNNCENNYHTFKWVLE